MKEGNIAIDPSTHLSTRAHVYAYISGTLTNCYNKLERLRHKEVKECSSGVRRLRFEV